ncbi:hypothetical protein ARMGADRAFT_80404 [Armillaria gallica]|uniref:Uncharacterized protein n=1 Tax=Armillaria gallica TaxID=47427 RepID=A0A2H3CU43_ARMGA|nr:hypothetical protein ARMGADRAFT_80404 [Armillaria gallica]
MEEVALAEEKLVSHPFLNAYNAFLVKDPTISSWSLARLKTPSITANNQDRNPNAKNERRVCLLSLVDTPNPFDRPQDPQRKPSRSHKFRPI